ncbi:MAG TPA: hypothetical protein VF789_07495 [Thermoanaerobaculia bacterium]
MKINLHIDRLVLEGIDLPHAQRPVLQAAVEAELGRLLAEGGVGPDLASGIAVPSVRAAGIEMGADGSPQQLGTQIARSVYGGIGK